MSIKFDTQPKLENSLVLLIPLTENHFEKLFEVSSDPEIWEQHPAKERAKLGGFRKFFDEAIQSKAAFLIIDQKSNEVIGTSRYKLSSESEKAIEIGWTFLAKKYWGGLYNKKIKELMLAHAFKTFEIILFYIAKENYRSRKAVEKLGGKQIVKIANKKLEIRPSPSVIYAIEKSEGLLV